MSSKLRTATSHLHTRRCVCCGFDGGALRRSLCCPSCGCDLRRRPARTYAEMEGLSPPPRMFGETSQAAEHRTIERWLAVLFLLMVGVLVASSLLADVIRHTW